MGVKKIIYPLIFGLCLTLFTAYLLLNTFVLEQVYTPITSIQDQLPTETENSAEDETKPPKHEKKEPVITDNSYVDENIEITITQYRESDTDIYVADVKISSVEYLKTALANNTFGKNITQTTSAIAQDNNAILAINGDFYGRMDSGYVLKNSILYRDEPLKRQEDLVIYDDGSFGFFLETEVDALSVFNSGAYQILAFGPSLIEKGRLTQSQNAPRGAINKNNPRTAIGLIDELHYMFVVCDGRTPSSYGLTTNELAVFMKKQGASYAYNLDGGGSATLYFNGKVINKPTFDGIDIEERKVSDIVYIGY